jgi:hypothetical protein
MWALYLRTVTSDSNAGARMAPDDGEHAQSPVNRSDQGNLDVPPGDATLTEDIALSLLKRPDLPAEVLERLGKKGAALKYRKVKLALVVHPRTPRHTSLPLVRQLYTFDLMQVSLTPTVPADLKLVADEALCNRLETISSGEKLTLAHRASGRVAAELLRDGEARVVHAALENPRLTESFIVRALMRPNVPAVLVEAVCHHPRWSLRCEVRVALLRTEKTPMARALEFARTMPAAQVREILQNSRLPGNVKAYLLACVDKRISGKD